MPRLTRNEMLQLIQEMRTVEMFVDQEAFVQRNITELANAIEQATQEIAQVIRGTHPRARRIIQSLVDGPRPIGVGGWTDRRLLSLLDTIDEMAIEIEAITGESMLRTSSSVASDIYRNYPDILSFGNRIPGFSSTKLSISQVRAYVEDTPVGGRPLREFVGRIFNDYTQADLRNEMFVGALQGESIPKLTKRIQEKYEWLDQVQLNRIYDQARRRGLSGQQLSNFVEKKSRKVIRQNAVTAARTHTQAVSNDAMRRVYSENEDIISKYKWNATMEPGYSSSGRGTCLRCAALDGQEYDSESEMPERPLHPNCRCVATPVTKSWQELGISGIQTDRIINRYRPYAVRESDAEIVKGRGRSIGAGGRRILGSSGRGPNRDYFEWYDDRDSFFKMNVAGPTRAKWLAENRRRSLRDLVDRNTGDIINVEDLPNAPDISTRRQYIMEHGTQSEIERLQSADQ